MGKPVYIVTNDGTIGRTYAEYNAFYSEGRAQKLADNLNGTLRNKFAYAMSGHKWRVQQLKINEED